METILKREQYILIYRTSYLSLVACLYALYQTHYQLAIVPGSVFIGSVLYWSKPDYSWRRYFDMTIAKTACIYQYAMAYNYEYGIAYYCITTTGLFCYPLGVYFYRKNDYWNSTYAHIAFHILANIGNFVLYSSRRTPVELPVELPITL